MNRNQITRLHISTLALTFSMPAFAHDGPHDGNGLIAQLVHLLTEPDHLAFIIIGGLTLAGLIGMTDLRKSAKSAILEKLSALRKIL